MVREREEERGGGEGGREGGEMSYCFILGQLTHYGVKVFTSIKLSIHQLIWESWQDL